MAEVKLIARTIPLDFDNAQDLIAFCARVSNPNNQLNFETAPKLLRYLVDNKHWSPFEIVNLVFEIKAPRDITRQMLRHQQKFQEFSQRYAIIEGSQFCVREARLQDKTNRQNSVEFEGEIKNTWNEIQESIVEEALTAYRWAIDNGIAKECARVVLPEGLTMTTMYSNATLRNWIHYCQIRREPSTQKEHREIANLIHQIILIEFPALEGLV